MQQTQQMHSNTSPTCFELSLIKIEGKAIILNKSKIPFGIPKLVVIEGWTHPRFASSLGMAPALSRLNVVAGHILQPSSVSSKTVANYEAGKWYGL